MSLRLRLLLLSLATLFLPWAGCQYARQMETVLRKGQEESLLNTARILQTAIRSDTTVLDQAFPVPDEAAHGELFAAQLLTNPLLDGFPDEWPVITHELPSPDPASRSVRLGIYGTALFAYLHVTADKVTYEVPQDDGQPLDIDIDRVVIVTRDSTGIEHAWSISAVAPGPIIVRRAAPQAPWKPSRATDNEIRGVWRATPTGFDVELRMPMRLVGVDLAIVPVVAHAAEQPPVELHALQMASPAMAQKIQAYAPSGIRISVLDARGWLLARAGTLASMPDGDGDNDNDADIPNLYRWLLRRDRRPAPTYGLPYGMWGPPIDLAREGQANAGWFAAAGDEPSTVRAAVPIEMNGRVVGALAVEQAGEQLLRDRDAALASLLQLAMLATLVAIVATLAFAAWISRRIRRLSIAAGTALSPEGRIEQHLPDTNARDELGDLARSFASLLRRINEYAAYLQTLGSKLSHELRTPLAIVSSSLDNLSAERDDPRRQEQFIARAREGTARLQTILSAMTEATRVEQSIEHAERVEFDLCNLLRSAATAYQQTFASHRIEAHTPEAPCSMRGAPELIAQLLDKLIDNAVDFCPANGLIRIELATESKYYVLIVSNEGPTLAPEIASRAFDMLVSNRAAREGKPHLGLGLYIVQLIARFHGGSVRAINLPDDSGVAFEVRLLRT